MRIVFLNGRQVPFISRVQSMPNQIPGFGIMGYIDVDAVDTTESFLKVTAADLA